MIPYDGQGFSDSNLERIIKGTFARFLLVVFLVRVGPILGWFGWLIVLFCCVGLSWQEYDCDKKGGKNGE